MTEDLQIKKLEPGSKLYDESLNKALNNKEIQQLVNLRKKQGYNVKEKNPTINQITDSDKKPLMKQVVFNIYEDSKLVGDVTFITGKDDIPYSQVKKGNTIDLYFIENDQLQHKEYNLNKPDEIQALISMSDCQGIVQAICSGGVVGSLTKCVAACAESGPGEAVCTPICGVILNLGCLFGTRGLCEIITKIT
ncbi:rRNA processing protein Gar1 [Scopulibacillus daqui]|uniref:rRNA processing protein Gar1 n=1 Tax=Scopulibacillus daqui TaxID=1469162 RepID=A0ABS2Q5C4_9BACL|nr:hypothetical protein [Scopulibacillus daqui]MBM7647025.1 rRNA processing protein Gar1 [Scopulibacillus daqui]